MVAITSKKNLITKEGYKKLLDELNERKTVIRRDIAEKIDEARKDGDLSENSAYTSAMEMKSYNDGRLRELEEILANSQIISSSSNSSVIGLGSKVVVMLNKKDKLKYTIVGVQESDPTKGYISDQSPIGQGLVGKRQGENVKISLPNGKVQEYTILEVA